MNSRLLDNLLTTDCRNFRHSLRRAFLRDVTPKKLICRKAPLEKKQLKAIKINARHMLLQSISDLALKDKRFNEYASRMTFSLPGWTYAGCGSNICRSKNPDSWCAAERTDARIYGPLLGISYVLDSAAGRWFAFLDVHTNRAASRYLEKIRASQMHHEIYYIYRVPA